MNEQATERLKCKTDLYYLATAYLGYDFLPDVHTATCDVFIKKDPTRDLYDQGDCRSRLLLDPRLFYKTTIDICDIVQWIIAFPNVRILITSGTEQLALRMLKEAKHHFLYNEKFRALFFEHALSEDDAGNSFEFTTPARTDMRLREPTVSVSTINSVKAGSHFDIIKFDDVVNEVNSQTREQLEKTISGFNSTIPLLEPGGYRDVIGTRYHHDDLYGWIMEHNEDGEWRIFKRAASSLPLTENSTFVFPKNAKGRPWVDYKALRKAFNSDPYMTGCQYYNDPNLGESSSFNQDVLQSACIPFHKIPLLRKDPLSGQLYRNAKCFITWDLAFGEKKTNDFTVGMVGCWDSLGRLYLVDMVRGRFSADELVYQFLYLSNKWYRFLGRVGIEDVAGSKLIMPSLKSASINMKLHIPIDWLPVNNKRTKNERILGLLPLLKQGKLLFNNDLPYLKELIDEFVKFPRSRRDDIMDAATMQLEYQNAVDFQYLAASELPDQDKNIEPSGPLGYGLVG